MLENLRKWVLTVSLAALAIAALAIAARGSMPEANAQQPAPARSVVCTNVDAKTIPKIEVWMNEQLEAGKTSFVELDLRLCAW